MLYENTLPQPIASRPQPDAAPAMRAESLGVIIGRIEDAVEQETAGLRASVSFDIKASNARKSRYLYELNRAMKGIGAADFLAEHSEGLRRLREKLARNESAIRAHLSAVNEVATLMRNAIQHSEADGTYSSGEFGWAR